MSQVHKRVLFVDRMRALWVSIMIIDHGLQGYAQTFGAFWFFQDPVRSAWCDRFHVFFNALLMPPFFFLAGLWFVPQLQKKGIKIFIKERFLRLGIPYMIGVVFLTPLMSFPRYHVKINAYDSYVDYWTGPFIWHHLQAGPFWFLSYLITLSLLFVAIHRWFHEIITKLQALAESIMQRPYRALAWGVVVFGIVQSVSDFIWGAPYWISLRSLWEPWGTLIFSVQGGRFIQQALFFALGVGIGQTQALQHLQKKVETQPHILVVWGGILLVLAVIYVSIAQPFDPEGFHGHHYTVWKTLQECRVDLIVLRTTMQGLICMVGTCVGLMAMMKLENKGMKFWAALTPCSYGMYWIHEVMTVGFHYTLSDWQAPIVVKLLLASFAVLFISWGLTRYVLIRIPFLGSWLVRG